MLCCSTFRCTIVVLLLMPLAGAMSAGMQALTISEAVDEALRNNRELRRLETEVHGAKGGVVTARTLPNPELTVEPGVVHSRGGDGSWDGFYGAFGLIQPFEFPGKRTLKIALAQRDVELREIAWEGFRFQLSTQVRRAFYELLVARKIAELRAEQVASARFLLESSRERVERGYASEFEAVKGEADVVASQKAKREADANLAESRVTLNALLGREPSGMLEVTGSLENLALRGGGTDFRALALARNPSLRARYLEAGRAGLKLRAIRHDRRPDFAIGPSVEYKRDEQIYGISATIALPFRDQKRGELQSADAARKEAELEIEKARLEIASAVTAATEKLEIARRQRALYTPEFLARLKSFVNRAEQQYTRSTTTLLMYLEAKKTYFDTMADYYDALRTVAANRAELESAVGVPLNAPADVPRAKAVTEMKVSR
jgi:cobalt-zinc-cadmium efflux system outer membrane protein